MPATPTRSIFRSPAQMAFAALALCSSTAFASVSDLSWLAGRWCSGSGADTGEEVWLAPAGGLMLGVSRTLRGGRAVEFEFLRIEESADGVVYQAQPGGRPAIAFRRSDGGDAWVRFDNPEHDFPQRIEYRRDGDLLRAEIAGPGRDGNERRIGFEFRRCEAPG